MDIRLLLDSGAFSAWSNDQVINLDDYINYIKEHTNDFDHYVNLDVIPSKKNVKATPQDIEDSVKKGYENYKYMIANGIDREKLIHVFHQRESFDWLKKMVKEIPYIGLSPLNNSSQANKKKWLDQCMSYVTDEKGYPLVKLHGFGIQSVDFMRRYPWYSVDAISWRLYSAYGVVLIPAWNEKGQYVYDRTPLPILFSIRGSTHLIMKKRYYDLPSYQMAKVDEYVKSKQFEIGENKIVEGKEVIIKPGLINDHNQRDLLNIIYFNDFLSTIQPYPHNRYVGKDMAKQGFSF